MINPKTEIIESMESVSCRVTADTTALQQSSLSFSCDHETNLCPDLLYISLSANSDDSQTAWIDLSLEVGEYVSGLTGGSVRYYLKRFEIRFDLKGCNMPVENRVTISDFKQSYSVNREMTADKNASEFVESSESVGVGLKSSIPSAEISMLNKASGSSSTKTTFVDKMQIEVNSIRTGGGPNKPYWIFTSQPGQQAVEGAKKFAPWGLLKFSADSGTLDATVHVNRRDIGTVGVSGLWPTDMNTRKSRVLRAFALTKIQHYPYISRVSISFFPSQV